MKLGLRNHRLLLTLGALFLFQIATITEGTPMSFPKPLSAEILVLSLLFVISIPSPLAHVVLGALLVGFHPLTSVFGRDGSMLVMLTYVAVVIWRRTSLAREHKLLAVTLIASVPLVEGTLAVADRWARMAQAGLADYGDLMGEYHEGGFLRPNLDIQVVGERGAVRFVTNERGFRRAEATSYESPRSFRVLFLGDSFVAGYRVDQEDAVGTVLEAELRRTFSGKEVEVLVAGAADPGAYLEYIDKYAFAFDPDVVLVGITLGNDISQAYSARNRLSFQSAPIATDLLPAGAFDSTYLGLLPVRLDRSFHAWRVYQRTRRLIWPEGIGSWYPDLPLSVHTFDAVHSLGHFYSGSVLAPVEQSFADLEYYLSEMKARCEQKRVDFVVAVFPQRFQVSEREWKAVTFRYALDPAAFDLTRPNARILAFCRERNIECADLLPAFRERQEEALYLPHTDMHWNAAGHRLAGHRLAEFLGNRLDGIDR
jgi:hypothetical protein